MATRDSSAKAASAGKLGFWQQRTWIWIIAAGLDVYILGFFIGLQPAGPLCGSPLLPNSRAAELLDLEQAGIGAAAACYRNIDSDSVPVWILMALGVGLVLTGVVVRIVRIRLFAGSGGVGKASQAG
ncbi:hypothetical protein QFZ36_001539 [Pseudarthrobacter siccitolerans]|uniref:Uncharacterized protein n=1 Tax=Pseudarthrobacter siccitolerans TaxID=861266 RepID=A0ABU0PJ41_9MICC|nr:hypothetical protein [Pseudarthrobacter siccitolerans]MDQ0673978.1 hypothetical protein [Pseudarthrobacter siccitolerans]